MSVTACFYHPCLATLKSPEGFQFSSKTPFSRVLSASHAESTLSASCPDPHSPIGLGVTIALSPALSWVWALPSDQHWHGCDYYTLYQRWHGCEHCSPTSSRAFCSKAAVKSDQPWIFAWVGSNPSACRCGKHYSPYFLTTVLQLPTLSLHYTVDDSTFSTLTLLDPINSWRKINKINLPAAWLLPLQGLPCQISSLCWERSVRFNMLFLFSSQICIWSSNCFWLPPSSQKNGICSFLSSSWPPVLLCIYSVSSQPSFLASCVLTGWPPSHLLIAPLSLLLASGSHPAGSHWSSPVSLLYCTFHFRIPLGSRANIVLFTALVSYDTMMWGASLPTEINLWDAGPLHWCTWHRQSKGYLGSNPNKCTLENHSSKIPRVLNSWIYFVAYPVWPSFYVVVTCALTEFSLKLGYGTSSTVFKVRSAAQRSLRLACYASPY